MRIDVDSRIPFPCPLVFETYRDHLPELVPYLPNVKSIEAVERKEEGGLIKQKNLWWAKGEIPKAAQSVLKPEMLSWFDFAEWDPASHSNTWRIEMRTMKEVVDCHGHNTFEAVDANTTVFHLRGELNLDLRKVPGVPRFLAGTITPTVEKFIVGLLKPNMTEVARGIEKYLAAKPK
jgi:hypothetical protein